MKPVTRLLFLVLFIGVSQAQAGIRPSFALDHCSWNATHIVVATEGGQIDGKLMVLESWKGDLNPGEVISVPELASFKTQSSRTIKTLFDRVTEGPIKYVTGSRMILFLIKNANPVTYEAAPKLLWSPADEAGINVSVVWVEGDQVFAFTQVMNPGPSLLTYYAKSESPIRSRVFDIIQLQDRLNETLAIRDCESKAALLQQYAVSDIHFVRELAFAEMQKCGESALPVLRRMLADRNILKFHDEVVKSLAKTGGDQVGEELTQLVRDEMEFWKATAPRLKKGWWNELDEPETETLRDRYGIVYEALRSLRELRFPGCKEAVTEFREFWRSLPQLEDKRGLDQMSQECDKILEELLKG